MKLINRRSSIYTIIRSQKLWMSTFILTILPIMFSSCTFDVSGLKPEDVFTDLDVPLADQICQDLPSRAFEDPGRIIVYHGFGCAESKRDGEQNFLRVEENLGLPDYVTDATVFQNGWLLQYMNGDHHIHGLGSIIKNILFRGGNLTWEALGVISDDNFNDPYKWTYHYTVIGWNENEIDVKVDHNDQDNIFYSRFGNEATTLKLIPGFIQNSAFLPGETVAILPRGFGFRWEDGVDHTLWQLAYNLDHGERYIQYEKDYMGTIRPVLQFRASYVDAGSVSWETKAIFKDDDLWRSYEVGEIVSALGGKDVNIVQPPFSLQVESTAFSHSNLSENTPTSKTYVVENLPFEYAIPVLSGWNLYYPDGDHHVQTAGIYLRSFKYQKAPTDQTGTLTYRISARLRDNDGAREEWDDQAQVQILGLKRTAGGNGSNVDGRPPTAGNNDWPPTTGNEVEPDTTIVLSK